MSILISGMEMPKNCDVCFMRDACEYSMPLGKRLTDCPLIEVPMSHGRLIDADSLVKSMRDFSYMWGERMNDEWIGEAPTIIPAEECET